MTVLLVLFTLIVLLTADYFVQRRKQKGHALAALKSTAFPTSSQWSLPADVVFAPNHLWMRREHDNSITVGIDNFITGIVGLVDRIQLPAEGSLVNAVTPAVVLHDKKKTLRLALPFEGQVVSVNKEAQQSPSLTKNNPYTSGWLFNFLPADSGKSLKSFLSGEAAAQWLRIQTERAKEFLASQGPQLQLATMQDGGAPVDGVLKRFDKNVWEEFQKQFVTLPNGHDVKEIGEYDNA